MEMKIVDLTEVENTIVVTRARKSGSREQVKRYWG